ncbi:hypothetical protein E1A91_D11G053900v1 [Gossypium mustelinum]|uniref:Uncharacterized protein n=4 Tax=Gossypium TaxID=3633 RepID=A0A5D2SMC8_GOSMU|nr:hypothetical protein ES288_D11G055700v1 [Gossypium darwinii]TYH42304.1 hypothetical protein ES332_D11G055300v1 [Gossypium tomentosum]TYI54127.1 hypothetical protein E1A91_D11G053900v1 [Gossypium mustelinum]
MCLIDSGSPSQELHNGDHISLMLTSRDIYDIAALCSRKERFFFKACGFRDDILGSTMMMYSRTVSSTCFEGERMVKQAGRKLLLVPSLQLQLAYSKTTTTKLNRIKHMDLERPRNYFCCVFKLQFLFYLKRLPSYIYWLHL